MENKKVVDKRSVKLEDVFKSDYIPFLGGRPQRSTIINQGDIFDLTIALNTTISVEDLLVAIKRG